MAQLIVACDGCRTLVESSGVVCVVADGHEGHYCEPCHEVYRQFLAACLVTEEKYNRLLDLEIHTMRERLPLLFVPQDLPRRARALEGLVLG